MSEEKVVQKKRRKKTTWTSGRLLVPSTGRCIPFPWSQL